MPGSGTNIELFTPVFPLLEERLARLKVAMLHTDNDNHLQYGYAMLLVLRGQFVVLVATIMLMWRKEVSLMCG